MKIAESIHDMFTNIRRQRRRHRHRHRHLLDHDADDEPNTFPESREPWIRGVNLGGWLVMERYITPYQFALTSCHLEGDFCWYPGQINAPPHAELCDLYRCHPVLSESVFGKMDFPVDEYTLWKTFGANNTLVAEKWLNYHLEYFVTEQDIIAVKESGATHIRVPLPHWILESQEDLMAAGELWIVGKRWEAFQRVVTWARMHGLQVWPDIHTAPGSQNGFDNSGRQYTQITCNRWMDNSDHVLVSLQTIRAVTQQIVNDGMLDVVTGFGLINEPFKDCDFQLYLDFLQAGFDIVQTVMGTDTYVYVSDLFRSESFNNGKWWMDPTKYAKTFLDTHYYHVFAERTRALSPKQHIALTCQNEYHVDHHPNQTQGGVAACCFADAPNNTVPSTGVRHMVGEWSAAVDTLPVDMLYNVMQNIAKTGMALHFKRQISVPRQQFLRNFVEAQQVIYEIADKGTGGAWFYWTLKMEGGAFAEWDFLRGIREGWIPNIPHPSVSSTSLFGTCYDILARTLDNMTVIHEYPTLQDDPDMWKGDVLDDDVVVSHGNSVLHPDWYNNNASRNIDNNQLSSPRVSFSNTKSWWASGLLLIFLLGFMFTWRVTRERKSGYSSIPQ